MIGSPHSARLRPFRPSAFGRYTLLTPLSVGGMGEIFLARLEGPQGFQKLCVIKKILPALARDPEFVERFVNEARTLVTLSHGAIAQVLDMGLHEGDPYIALEYVDGKDLRKVAARARERGEALPLSFSLYVMGRLLDALAYAHRKRDEDERELGLVHRDVSPQNVLISYEGEIKIIDFGLAKSSLNSARTNPSMILGKFLYMSPEQARHQKVDRRADLYAAGLCLYELVAGRHPFEDVPSHALITSVANPSVVPLREAHPECPPALHDIVMRALEVEPQKRFQTAEEFRAKVGSALLEIDGGAGPESASRYMREMFAAEFGQERKLLVTLRSAQPSLPTVVVSEDVAEPGVPSPEQRPRESDRETAVVALQQVVPEPEAQRALQAPAAKPLMKSASTLDAGPILPAPLSFAPTRRAAPAPSREPEQEGDRTTLPGVALGTPLPELDLTPRPGANDELTRPSAVAPELPVERMEPPLALSAALGDAGPSPTSELPVFDPSALQFDPDEELAAARQNGTMPRVVIAELPLVDDTQPRVVVGTLLEDDAEESLVTAELSTELSAELSESPPASNPLAAAPVLDERTVPARPSRWRGPLILGAVIVLGAIAFAVLTVTPRGRPVEAQEKRPETVTRAEEPKPAAVVEAPPGPTAPPPNVRAPFTTLPSPPEKPATPEVVPSGGDVLELLEVEPAQIRTESSTQTQRAVQKKPPAVTSRDVQREWSQLQAVMTRVEKRWGCDSAKLETICTRRDWLRADLRKLKGASQEDLVAMRTAMRELRMKAARVEKGR